MDQQINETWLPELQPIETVAPSPRPAAVVNWPRPLATAAFYGLPGDVVKTLEPHTEADIAGVLTHFLVGVGNAVGRGPHWRIGGVRHYTNLFCVNVGATAARKGTAKAAAFAVMERADQDWYTARIQSGLSSGEGLIWAVRDPIEEHQPVRQHGKVIDYQDVIVDPGADDKRLLVVEAEFGSTLRMMERDGNVLSATLRQSWDGDDLRVLTKSKAAKSSNPHISLIAHITQDELSKYLTETEQANGFANRVLWTAVQRSKLLPSGGHLGQEDVARLTAKLKDAIEFARTVSEVKMDLAAKQLWESVYERLVGDHRQGLFGAATARAAPQVVRIALLYALLDYSASIKAEHLMAGLEVWRYCEDSARCLFGDRVGDRIADEILIVIRGAQSVGITRTELSNHFGRNLSGDRLGRALGILERHNLIRRDFDTATGGRAAERWTASRY